MGVFQKLNGLLGYENVVLTNSGNSAIFAALHLCKRLGKTEVLIPREGGWFSYKHYPGVLGMSTQEVETDWALLDLEDLNEKCTNKSVMLYATIGGYFVEEPVAEIARVVHSKGGLVIGDVSPSLGLPGFQPEQFDFIVASFGNHKPVAVGYGGVLASNLALDSPVLTMLKFPKVFLSSLQKELSGLNQKWVNLLKLRKSLGCQLPKHGEIAWPGSRGMNIMVKGKDAGVIEFCKSKGLPYLICPRYNRVKKKGISIELKRLELADNMPY